MIVLKNECKCELLVKKSRFISIARKCTTIEDVKKIVDETRNLYPDASHVVHAAVIGESQFSFSDDHEPKNTAGRPAFEVLKGSGISNICVIVIRYFGGTLLGTGGLVKAYGDSVRNVLDIAETQELVERTGFCFTTEYQLYDKIKLLISGYDIENLKEEFLSTITISGDISSVQLSKMKSEILNLSNGRIHVSC